MEKQSSAFGSAHEDTSPKSARIGHQITPAPDRRALTILRQLAERRTVRAGVPQEHASDLRGGQVLRGGGSALLVLQFGPMQLLLTRIPRDTIMSEHAIRDSIT